MTLSHQDFVFLENVHRWCRLKVAAFGKQRKYQPRKGFTPDEIATLQAILALDAAVKRLTSTELVKE